MSYYYESKPDGRNYHYINHKVCPLALPHFHSAIEFLIVRRGRMLATVNGEEYVIEEGYGCFVDRFCLHSYSELENNTEVYSFVGNSEIFESVFADIAGVPPLKFEFSDFSLLDMAEKCYKDVSKDGARLAVFKGAVGMILSVISQNNSLCRIGERGSSDNICAVLRYISEHFREDLSLEILADEFGYSPQYFSRMFHKYMNAKTNVMKRMSCCMSIILQLKKNSNLVSLINHTLLTFP